MSRRVLVVEDEPAIRLVVSDALSDEGHEVRTAGTGLAALELLDGWTPDLILLDLTLPEMDGHTFRTRQRSLPAPASEIPVVLVTGAYHREDVVRELDAAALLRKPFDLDALVRLVADLKLPS